MQALVNRVFPKEFNVNAQPSSFFTVVSDATVNPIVLNKSSNNGQVRFVFDCTNYDHLRIRAVGSTAVFNVQLGTVGGSHISPITDQTVNGTRDFDVDVSEFVGDTEFFLFNRYSATSACQLTVCKFTNE